MSKIKVLCEICNEHIAMADTDTLRMPMMGSMFTSPDPFHGVPAPFDPSTPWVHMACPWCRKRPFMEEDRVLTADGRIKVGAIPPAEEPKEIAEQPDAKPTVIDLNQGLSQIEEPVKEATPDTPPPAPRPETARERKLRIKREWVREHRAKQKAAKEVSNA
jgi:hypothetical protein